MSKMYRVFAALLAGLVFNACADDNPRGGITDPIQNGPDLSWIRKDQGADIIFNPAWVAERGHRDVYEAWVTTARHEYSCALPQFRMTRNSEQEPWRFRKDREVVGLPSGVGTGMNYCWRNPQWKEGDDPAFKYTYAQFGANYDKLSAAEKTTVQFSPDGHVAALALFHKTNGEFVFDRQLVHPDLIIPYKGPDNPGGNQCTFNLTHSTMTGYVGEGVIVHYTSSNCTGTPVWTSSSTVATVNANGVVTATAPGTVVITGVLGGITRTTTITFSNRVSTCELTLTSVGNGGTVTLTSIGATHQITHTSTSGCSGNVAYSSNNAQVATVSNNGVVTATGNGSAIITVAHGGSTKTFTATVNAQTTQARDTAFVVGLNSAGTAVRINAARFVRWEGNTPIYLTDVLSALPAEVCSAAAGLTECRLRPLREGNTMYYEVPLSRFHSVGMMNQGYFLPYVDYNGHRYWYAIGNRTDVAGVCQNKGDFGWSIGVNVTSTAVQLRCQ